MLWPNTKRYVIVMINEDQDRAGFLDFDKKSEAIKMARKMLRKSWGGVALVDSKRQAITNTYGHFPEIWEIFDADIFRDARIDAEHIQSLAQFKAILRTHKRFRIVKYYDRPEWNWQVRVPTKVQVNGFYSVIQDDPEHEISQANDGLGVWMPFLKAENWLFTPGKITAYSENGNPIYDIKFI